jgi:(R,R)-butanediol dehydrogenase/meso-butanediol dehydrogenase/diacetyl reductase
MPAAVIVPGNKVEIQELPVPEPGSDEVLVEVSHCGVCGSDLHFVLEGWGQPGGTPGHEWSGRLVAVGDGVADWKVGDAVVGGPGATCGVCEPCRAGRPSVCVERGTPGAEASRGAFAPYKRARVAELVRVPDALDLRTAALAEPLAVALHGITLSGLTSGQRAFVAGAGPIGTLTIAALRALGIDDITVSEPNEARRRLASQLGATRVVTPDELDVPPMWEPVRIVEGAADAALECSGKAVAMETALAQLKKAGTLVLVGAGIEPPRFDPNRILLNELVITGAYEYDAGGIEAAVEMLAAGAVPADLVVEPDDVPLDDLLATMERMAAGEVAGKVMVKP